MCWRSGPWSRDGDDVTHTSATPAISSAAAASRDQVFELLNPAVIAASGCDQEGGVQITPFELRHL